MRKSQTQKISDLIREYLSEINADRKLKEVQIISQWEAVMGKTVATRTNKIYIRNRTLFLHITSPVLKNELLMIRNEIIKRLNELTGETIIDQIVLR